MIVWCNGRFLTEREATVPVLDRGFLYGDGLFESIPVYRGTPFRWDQHLDRLIQGAAALRIPLPRPPADLRSIATELIRRNRQPEAILRVALSRGVGARGYSIRGAGPPTLVITFHPLLHRPADPPVQWRLVTSSIQLPAGDRLAQHKTACKLPQILARLEAEEAGADEALLLNTDGQLTEGSSANVFWIEDDTVCTPPASVGALPGITRMVVFECCRAHGWPCREQLAFPATLRTAAGVFLTLSAQGIVEALTLDGQPLSRSPRTEAIRLAYWQTAAIECSSVA